MLKAGLFHELVELEEKMISLEDYKKNKTVLDRFQDSSKTGSRICFNKCFF